MQGLHVMTQAEYFADPAPTPSLSNSLIKVLLSKSPKHAFLAHPRLNPYYESGAHEKFDLGTAAHGMLLEGVDKCCVVDAPDWRGKAAKGQRETARAMGLTPLLIHQHTEAKEMVEVAKDFIKSTQLGDIMDPLLGTSERVMMWEEGPIWCRGMIDRLSEDCTVFVDYKTTSARNPADFIRTSITQYGYDTQLVLYKRGLAACGHRSQGVLLVQEDTAPFACYLVDLSESMVELADNKIRRAMEIWASCLATNDWPAYGTKVYSAEAPAWAVREELSRE